MTSPESPESPAPSPSPTPAERATAVRKALALAARTTGHTLEKLSFEVRRTTLARAPEDPKSTSAVAILVLASPANEDAKALLLGAVRVLVEPLSEIASIEFSSATVLRPSGVSAPAVPCDCGDGACVECDDNGMRPAEAGE